MYPKGGGGGGVCYHDEKGKGLDPKVEPLYKKLFGVNPFLLPLGLKTSLSPG